MAMAKRTKRKLKTRSRIHVARHKAARKLKTRSRAANNVSRSRRKARAAAKPRKRK